ncbi:MAG: hypothetical protein ACHP6I_02085 [Rickettsiales bacterium]
MRNENGQELTEFEKLIRAIRVNNRQEIDNLLDNDISLLDQVDHEGLNVLHHTVRNYRSELFKEIALSKPILITQGDKNNRTPLLCFLENMELNCYAKQENHMENDWSWLSWIYDYYPQQLQSTSVKIYEMLEREEVKRENIGAASEMGVLSGLTFSQLPSSMAHFFIATAFQPLPSPPSRPRNLEIVQSNLTQEQLRRLNRDANQLFDDWINQL